MKKNSKITAVVCFFAASLGVASLAQAQTQNNPSRSPNGNVMYGVGNSYVGLGIGRSDFSLGNGLGVFNSDQGDTAYRVNVGTYFHPNFGVDLAYTDFGKTSRSGGTTKAEALSLSLVGRYSMTNALNLLGKVGTTFGRTNVSSSASSGVTAGEATGFGALYGIGVEYQFTPAWSALLEYDTHNLKFAPDRYDRVGATTLGVRHAF